MKKAFYVFALALLGQAVSEKVSYRNYKVYKVTPNNAEALDTLRSLDAQATEFSAFQFWNGPTKVGRETTLMVGPTMQDSVGRMLEQLDVDSKVMIEDVQQRIDAENRKVRTSTVNSVNWLQYNTYSEITAWLEECVREFPNALTLLNPGSSHEGRPIVGVRLDFNPNVTKEVVFMESNIHAREWITSATTTYILDQFLRSTNESVRSLAEKYVWYFFPLMNPDGFVYSHEVNRMWRKTRTRYTVMCYGADPNRNWGFEWMNGGANQNPCSDIYAGPRPFSEPSVEVMREFIANIITTENMVAYLDFHSFSQMLLLPYGHTYDPLDNYQEMMEIAAVAMTNLTSLYNTEYVWGNVAETIYIASGSSMDWVKGTFNVPIVVTYELRDRGEYGFILPPEQILPTAEETLVSVISIFEEWEKRHPSN